MAGFLAVDEFSIVGIHVHLADAETDTTHIRRPRHVRQEDDAAVRDPNLQIDVVAAGRKQLANVGKIEVVRFVEIDRHTVVSVSKKEPL